MLDAAPSDMPRMHLCRMSQIDSWYVDDLSAPYWRCYVPLNPGGIILLDGRSLALRPGVAYLVAPATSFDSRSERPFRKAYLHFTWHRPGLVPVQAVHHRRIGHTAFRTAIASGDSAIFAATMISVAGGLCQALPTTAFRAMADPGPLVRRAQELLSGEGVPPGNAPVAQALGIHAHSLLRLFATALGCSPQAWAREQRLVRAAEMLGGTTCPIEAIAERCGFWDRNHFTRAFTRRWQCPPAAFRRREHGVRPAPTGNIGAVRR